MNFETSLKRLEEILEELGEGSVPLDSALKLYEEADKLVIACHKKLKGAEERVQTLIKKRDGELSTDRDGNPETEDFNS